MTQTKRGPQKGEGGAPKVAINYDADRYLLATALALECCGMPRLRACRLAIAILSGRQIPARAEAAQRADKMKADTVALSYELRPAPGAPATIDGKAATLRRKLDQDRTASDALWLKHMSLATMVALGGDARDLNQTQIRGWAEAAGESDFADAVLIPVLLAGAPNI